MADLGSRFAVGALSTANKVTSGAWVVTFRTQDMPLTDYEIWHGACVGPGGFFQVYKDDSLFGIGENGRINEYSPRGAAMYVRAGQSITFHWSIATGTAPQVTLYLREPEVGKL